MNLFDALPGLDIPIGQINSFLQGMWGGALDDSPSDFCASQLNLVIHFGDHISVESGLHVFQTAVDFAASYPSKIIILCPQQDAQGALKAKIFSQCYIGDSQSIGMCNFEAIIIAYTHMQAVYLEDLISVWLDNDLPVYHWLHGINAAHITAKTLHLFNNCRRVIYDSRIDNQRLEEQIPWSQPYILADLTHSVLLPARQSMGQVLSTYPPSVLVDGLVKVSVGYGPGYQAQAASLLKWQKQALCKCFPHDNQELNIQFELKPQLGSFTLRVDWQYTLGQTFVWSFDEAQHSVGIEINLQNSKKKLNQPLKLLKPDVALAEAMFFAS